MFTKRSKSHTSRARRGVLRTAHGDLQTPLFMPIATKGAVKTISTADLERLGSPILLANTYHLYLRPGLDVLRSFGGLHRFMSWNGAILSDSGGYQVFSLANMRKLTEDGAHFRSHIDGSSHLLTPERSIEIQHAIGSDICMVLDECPQAGVEDEYMRDSIARTTRWAQRCKYAFELGRAASNAPASQLFGIVQGGINEELRAQSAHKLLEIGFDGYAIGGLSVGEPFEDACRIVERLDHILPEDKPRYFMGGAQPEELVAYVRRGVDLFDCVLPTRNARHGLLYRFVHEDLSQPDFYETVHLTNASLKTSHEPLIREPSSSDRATLLERELARYTLGYLRHLFSVQEMLASRLVTLANLRFYLELMERMRQGIEEGRL